MGGNKEALGRVVCGRFDNIEVETVAIEVLAGVLDRVTAVDLLFRTEEAIGLCYDSGGNCDSHCPLKQLELRVNRELEKSAY